MPSHNSVSTLPEGAGDHLHLTLAGRAAVLARLFRISNSVLLGSLAIFSVLVTGGGKDWTTLHLCFLFASWTALAATAYAINDLVDRVADRVNRPCRYLQRVERTPRWIVASVCLVAFTAVAAGAFVPLNRFLALEAAWSSCAIGYSFGLKRRSGVLANILSALCVSASAAPGLIQGSSPRIGALLPVLFFVMLAREIWKDIEDEPGDLVAGLRTLPILRGKIFAARTACMASAAASLMLILDHLPGRDLGGISVCFGIFGVFASALLFRDPEIMPAHRIQRLHRHAAIIVFAIFVAASGVI